ncbi:MAG TPA: hypothetical protein PKA88_01840 [Polyangiaceae bacterium]|nr:hypothetical protein [Polyangiaceae bacterium]
MVAAALLATLLTVSTRARAEDAPRRGLYTALAFGPTFVAGKVDYSKEETSIHEDFSGGGGDLRFAIGYAPSEGLAVAVRVGTSLTDAEVRVPDGSRDIFTVWSAGALIDWFPFASVPAHLELGLGYTVTTFLAGGTDSGGGQDSRPGLGGDGAVGRAGVGYLFARSADFGIGPLLAVSTLRTRNATTRTAGNGIALLLQLTWF